MNILRAKWGLVIKAFVVAVFVTGAKVLVDFIGWDLIPVSALTSALVTGVFFVIAILLAGVLTDFKESEKMLGEFAASIETLYNDARLIGSDVETAGILEHVRGLIHTAITNFQRHGKWNINEINDAIQRIDEDILYFNRQGKPLGVLLRMRAELTNVKRVSFRIQSIKETTFLPAAHGIAEVSFGGIVLVLLLSDITPLYEGLLVVAALTLILTAVVLLIEDMDNPFEGYATIDLGMIYKLDKYLDDKQAEYLPV